MKLRTKLLGGFLFVAAMAVTVAVIGYNGITKIDAGMDEITDVRLPSLEGLYLMMDARSMITAGETALLNTRIADKERADAEKNFVDSQKNFDEGWKIYEPLPQTVEEAELWKTFVPLSQQWWEGHRAFTDAVKVWQSDKSDASYDAMLAKKMAIDPIYDESESMLDRIVEINREVADAASKQAQSDAASARQFMAAVGVIAVLLALIIGFLITNSIVKPVRAAANLAQLIEKGDLSQRLDIQSRDEIGQMSTALNSMAEGLRTKAHIAEAIAKGDLTSDVHPASAEDVLGAALLSMTDSLNMIISQVNEAAEQTASGSSQVSDASQSLSQGATEQAASLEEITSSVTQISSQIKTNADNAGQANKLSGAAREAANRGHQQMEQMITAMNEIQASSREVVKIVKVIDDIAFQTNLLALNAAVEAARAGSHGRGFAVVAEEVRNLAARSAKAAKETAEGIASSMQRVEHGNAVADKTAQALAEIREAAAKVNDLVGEIAAASHEQSQAIEQVGLGLGQIDSVTQQNTANAEETASAAEELSSQSAELKHLLSHFQLRSGDRSHTPLFDSAPAKSHAKNTGSGSKKSALPHPVSKLSSHTPNKPGKSLWGDKGSPKPAIALTDSEFGRF
jgi:methyl-accepting chemotaxis protein